MLGNFIQQQRTKRNLTQEYLASELGISRPTYLQIERGERELTVSEARKLADVFDISLEDFLAEKEEAGPEVKITGKKRSHQKVKKSMRISVPQEKAEKFEQTLLYILSKIGGQPNIGQTVLYKLLYFIDFDYYEKFEEQLIGAKYIKNHYGPTPVVFTKLIDRLEKKGKVEKIKSKFYQHEQTKYLVNPNETIDVSALSSRELAHIDWEIDRLGDLTASQISALSHLDTPWRSAKDREILEYEHVFYRPDETSVRQYEKL
jgi:transcriptional regulator with XRE-family HTH domain